MHTTEGMIEGGVVKREDVQSLVEEHKPAIELSDEMLFKDHPPQADCEICYLPLPLAANEKQWQACCGKLLCRGCVDDLRNMRTGYDGDHCPFCREVSTPSNMVERVMKRVKVNDPNALLTLYDMYSRGTYGHPKDNKKALITKILLGPHQGQLWDQPCLKHLWRCMHFR